MDSTSDDTLSEIAVDLAMRLSALDENETLLPSLTIEPEKREYTRNKKVVVHKVVLIGINETLFDGL